MKAPAPLAWFRRRRHRGVYGAGRVTIAAAHRRTTADGIVAIALPTAMVPGSVA